MLTQALENYNRVYSRLVNAKDSTTRHALEVSLNTTCKEAIIIAADKAAIEDGCRKVVYVYRWGTHSFKAHIADVAPCKRGHSGYNKKTRQFSYGGIFFHTTDPFRGNMPTIKHIHTHPATSRYSILHVTTGAIRS